MILNLNISWLTLEKINFGHGGIKMSKTGFEKLDNIDLMNYYAKSKISELTFQEEKIFEKELRLNLGRELLKRLEKKDGGVDG